MTLTQNIATEQYQLAHKELSEIAEDYNASDEASEIALAAAEKLTLKYIDEAIEEINALNRQYESFIDTMEYVIDDLSRTSLERLLLDPLKQRVQIAKKKVSKPPVIDSWQIRWQQFLEWMRTRQQ